MDKTTRRKELHDLADHLQGDVGNYESKFTFPLEHIIACLRDDNPQSCHSPTVAKERYKVNIAEPIENPVWFYFRSPDWTWESLCGRAGWLVATKDRPREIAFFLEVMN